MNVILQLIVVFSALMSLGSGSLLGFTTSNTNMTQTNMNCFFQKGATFFVGSGLSNYGKFDPNVCSSLEMAKNAGVTTRDVHLFPCPTCTASASSQMKTLLDGMATCKAGLWSGKVWFDVSNSQYWYTPWRDVGYKQNTDFFEDMVDACLDQKANCGIYSNHDQWMYTFHNAGYSYAPSLSMPLWFINHENVADMSSGFTAFGGFTKPFAKEYKQEPIGFCGYETYWVYDSVSETY